jgi:hypothetical protein
MVRPTSVKALPNFRIWLQYDNGVEGEVDLSDLAGRGVFAAWNDRAFFEAVRLGDHGAIEWNQEIDICPDSMYLRITGQPVEALASRSVHASA